MGPEEQGVRELVGVSGQRKVSRGFLFSVLRYRSMVCAWEWIRWRESMNCPLTGCPCDRSNLGVHEH